ncbi:MAG TPA: EAL domain-containing protein [Candidatus Cybelea sp.]|nr:EAL domain-containing protein [Candidatus Cybelea sp.]
MSLPSHLVVMLAYALLSAALAVSYGASIGADAPIWTLGGLCFLTAALAHQVVARILDRRDQAKIVLSLRQTDGRLQSDVDAARRELSEMRRRVEGVRREGEERVAGEMQVIKGLLQQLSERMTRRRVSIPGTAAMGAVPEMGTPANASRRDPPAALPPEVSRQLDFVRQALEDNRVDVYLQPIVSLPQRKVRFYESFSRIRAADGGVLGPEQYLPLAADSGLIATIDNLLLFRCIQLIRRMRGTRRDVGFFVNVSMLSLQDEEFFGQFHDFLRHNADLADNLFFEFAQGELARHGGAASSAMARLAELGFRFSLDQVSGLDVDYAALAARNFRFVKIDARALTSKELQSVASIDIGDLKAALNRHGIDLIAEKVETEPMVVDLLDFEVDYGQGYLFGEPRRSREAA